MERISGKERLRRIPTNKIVYFAAIISLIILVVLILMNYVQKDENEIIIKNIKFEDIGDDVYLKMKIENPTNEQKSCFLNIMLAEKKYKGYVNLSAKSKKSYTTPIDMPDGKTEIKIGYNCS